MKKAAMSKPRGVAPRLSIVTALPAIIILNKKPNVIIPINIIKKKVKTDIMIKAMPGY